MRSNPSRTLGFAIFFSRFLRIISFFALVSISHIAIAQPVPDAEIRRLQTQQQTEAQSRANAAADVFTKNKKVHGEFVLPIEKICFSIRNIKWLQAHDFTWVIPEEKLLIAQCVGAKGLRAFQEYLTGKLIERGYVTSRVLIPEQNLAEGNLQIQILPGRIGKIRDEGDALGWYGTALPGPSGNVLNQRDLDQALENIRRLSSQQDVTFDLVPGDNPGETDVIIKHVGARRWHALATLDNSGADVTGKYQLGGVLVVDSPFGLYDSLTVTLNNDASIGNGSLGTTSDSINWSMPYGYWSLMVGGNRSKYKQTVAGYNGAIVYSGRSTGTEIGVGYIPYRNAKAKTGLQFKLNNKTSRSNIDDTEVIVQRRDIVGYELDLKHRQFIDSAVLDLGISIRGSLPGLSSTPGLIVGAPEWNGRYLYQAATASIYFPLQFGTQSLRVQSSFRIQHASTLLPATDYFSIGNRYSVRGFDGERTLSAENGWVWRNDLSWPIGRSGQEVYFALDAGHVSGPSAAFLLGSSLGGEALGVRGRLGKFFYDLTAGRPFRAPAGFTTQKPTYTISVSAEY